MAFGSTFAFRRLHAQLLDEEFLHPLLGHMHDGRHDVAWVAFVNLHHEFAKVRLQHADVVFRQHGHQVELLGDHALALDAELEIMALADVEYVAVGLVPVQRPEHMATARRDLRLGLFEQLGQIGQAAQPGAAPLLPQRFGPGGRVHALHAQRVGRARATVQRRFQLRILQGRVWRPGETGWP